MLTEVIAFLAHPEDYRAIWRDGELTIEAIAATERLADSSEAMSSTDDEPRRPTPTRTRNELSVAA